MVENAFADALDAVKAHLQMKLKASYATLPAGAFRSDLARQAAAFLVENDFEELCKYSKRDPDAFWAIRFGLANRLERGAELDPEQFRWLQEFLTGKHELPSKRGRGTALFTDLLVYEAVEISMAYGLTRYRNDFSAPLSAYDVVAEAMRQLKLRPQTYSGVRERHRAMDKKLRSMRAVLRLFD